MRFKLPARPLLLLGLIGTIMVLVQSEAQSQNKLPPRPPIFLNNNASLYTFPNPNAGKPSQLPFAFVAVAHEDCRLFNNGAMLMPKHRLMAAECITGPGGANPPPMPLPPPGAIGICCDPGSRFGRPVFPIVPPPPPGVVTTAVCIDIRAQPCNVIPLPGGFGGINYGRSGLAYPYGGVPAGYTGNYGSYNPSSAQSTLTTGSSDPTSQSRSFRGFGLAPDGDAPEFLISVGLAPLNRFGGGFGVKDYCCGSGPEPGPEPTIVDQSEDKKPTE